MQRDGQHHHGRAGELTFWALGLLASDMQVRDQMVKRQQKQNAEPEAEKRRNERELSHSRRLLNRRDQKAPDGGRHHHARGKARQRALHKIAKRFFHEEHAGRAGRCAKKWDEYAKKRLHRVSFRGYLFLR